MISPRKIRRTSVASVMLAAVFFAMSEGSAHAVSQEEAFSKVWGISEGRARPSRRDLKAAVKEDVIESSDSFEDDRRLRLRVQQERTRDALREVKLRRVLERKAAAPIESERGNMTARVKSRVLGAKVSGPVDLSSCEGLYLKAKLGCTVRLRREARAALQPQAETNQSETIEIEAAPEQVDAPEEAPIIRSQTSE